MVMIRGRKPSGWTGKNITKSYLNGNGFIEDFCHLQTKRMEFYYIIFLTTYFPMPLIILGSLGVIMPHAYAVETIHTHKHIWIYDAYYRLD